MPSLVSGPASSSPPVPSPITLAIVNARVQTGDPARPWAEAVAIAGDRIAAVGSTAAIRKALPREARVIDAAGGLVCPVRIDAGDARGGASTADGPRATDDVAVPAPVMLQRGARADLVLFDRAATGAPSASMDDVAIRVRVVAGVIVHERR